MDIDAVFAREFRLGEVQRFRGGGERAERIQPGRGVGDRLQADDVGVELVDEPFIEELLARERQRAGGERLVLEGLQLRRDEALRVLHRLAALVLDRNLVELALRHLDEEAVHAAEFHAQVGDAGAGSLALLHGEEEHTAVVLDRAQLVQLGVEAVADHAAFADHRRGLVLEGRREPLEDRIGGPQVLGHRVEAGLAARHQGRVEVGQRRERVAQAREVARARRAECHARGDALDVGPRREELGQPRMA